MKAGEGLLDLELGAHVSLRGCDGKGYGPLPCHRAMAAHKKMPCKSFL